MLDEAKCEIRIQFKPVGHRIYGEKGLQRNEYDQDMATPSRVAHL